MKTCKHGNIIEKAARVGGQPPQVAPSIWPTRAVPFAYTIGDKIEAHRRYWRSIRRICFTYGIAYIYATVAVIKIYERLGAL